MSHDNRKVCLLLAALLLIAAAPAPDQPAGGGPATRPAAAPNASFELVDVDGTTRRPLEAARAAGARAVVFLFTATDCPISNGYAPEFKRICARYGGAGDTAAGAAGNADGARAFDFYLVHAEPGLSPADAKKHATDYGYTCPVLLDTRKRLAGKLGAKVTPEAFVVAPDGSLLYRGRIDDQFVDYGKRREAPTTHDLRDVLDAVLAGKPVPTAQTQAIGCPIE